MSHKKQITWLFSLFSLRNLSICSHVLPQDEKIKLTKCVYPRDFARLFTGLFDSKKLSRIKPSGQVVDETKITSWHQPQIYAALDNKKQGFYSSIRYKFEHGKKRLKIELCTYFCGV